MFGRGFVAMFFVLFAAAALSACSQSSDRALLETCKSSDKSKSVDACSKILSRRDQVSAADFKTALVFRALAYEGLCKNPAALADHREMARLYPQEAATGNIRILEAEIAATSKLPPANATPPSVAAPRPAEPDAITWTCITKWDEPPIELLRSFVKEVPQSVHHRDAKDRLDKREAKLKKAQAQFDDQVLLGTVGGTALGGVILAALLLPGWRTFAVPAFFGLLAGIMVEPVLQRTIVQPLFSITVSSMLLGVGAALAARVIAELFLAKLLSEIRDDARETLVPERWTSPQGLTTMSARDQVKRWFVTIAAATGSVVGSMFGLDVFWTTLAKTIEPPRSIVFAALLVGVSMFLIGPVQAYVFDVGARADHPSDPSKKISDLFAGGVDWRAAGRFALVFLAYVQIYLLTSCVGAAIKEGSARTVSIIFACAATPAIVSYYWSAALQRGVPSVLNATFKPSLYAGAVMAYGTGLTLVLSYTFDFEYTPGRDHDAKQALFFFLFSPAIAIFPALVIGALTTLIYSVAGATAIDRFPRQYTMLFVAAALLVAATIQATIIAQVLVLVGFALANILYATFVGSMVGWLVGLWASAFPRLLAYEAAQGGRAQ